MTATVRPTGGLHDSVIPDVRQHSVGDLLGEVSRDLSTLMRQEVALAKAEVRQEGVKAGKAAGLYGAAGLAGYMTVLFLSIALWWGLSNVMDQGWAALVVALVWLVVAGVLYPKAKAKVRELQGMPQTAETVQQIPGALKPHPEGVRHDR
ncbi:MAG TPA: phage holin family protein [Micromonospora sp.]